MTNKPGMYNRENMPDAASVNSPFVPAAATEKRLKLFLWGDSGSGKTTLALQFPAPAVIDLERGTELYGKAFKFDVLPASTAKEVIKAVDWLLINPHSYRTLIIDPITIFWDALQKQWSDIFLERNQTGKGYKFEYYDMQIKDWNPVKAELKDFIRKLLALDMNVIITARQKYMYSKSEAMKVIGETFDGEKSLPYMFDTIVHLYRNEGRFMGNVTPSEYIPHVKDRNNMLPNNPEGFEISYALFEKLFGAEQLTRPAKPQTLITAEQTQTLTGLIAALGLNPVTIKARLENYGASMIEELTEVNAQVIIKKLEAALAKKNQ